MKNIFQKIKKIKAKLLLQYGILIVLSIFLMAIMLVSLKKITNYSDSRQETEELYSDLLQMRKSEKDYLLQDLTNEIYFDKGISSNISNFDTLYNVALKHIQHLTVSEAIQKLELNDSIQTAKIFLSNYAETFHKMTDLYKARGFKNWGSEGKLRESIHAIEKGEAKFDEVIMLTLRRCEKDFLLRKDLAYVEKFDAAIEKFKKSLTTENYGSLYFAINNYKNEFHNVVDAEQLIGLTNEEGIRKELMNVVNRLEPLLMKTQATMKIHVETIVTKTYRLIAIVFIIQLIIAIYLAISFSNATTNSIKTIQERISKLSEGKFPEKINTKNKDEIGQTSISFNNLIDRIRTASEFSNKIGNGELGIKYDENFNNDVLAVSLQNMHEKLVTVARENEHRNWINEGLTKFVDLTRDTSDIQKFYNTILSNIIKYIKANQGYLYILNEEDENYPFMEIKAVYAYGKEKYIDEKKKIKYQEGLIGQAWFDKEALFFTEIPQDYVNITSGMGEATPTCIFISPLIINENIVGLVEIATFEQLENHKVEFVNKVCESIANTIISVKTNEKTVHLLEQSQQITEEMRAQEEEIRQNIEEMHATQEELERKEREMTKRVRELESELENYKNSKILNEN